MTESSETPDSKRQAIMQAATRLFLTNNYRSVSMDKIAQAAPVSKATLYNYFDSKNDLLVAVVHEICASIVQAVTQTLSTTDDIKSNLRKIASTLVDVIYSTGGLAIHRLLLAESHEFPELGQMVYDKGVRPTLEQLETYLQQLNDSGHFSIPAPSFAADAFFSLLEGKLHFRCLLGVQPPPNEAEKIQLIESAIAFFLRGIGYEED
jgi:TetR/AcrR family transcriptional repressor of mexJK operon